MSHTMDEVLYSLNILRGKNFEVEQYYLIKICKQSQDYIRRSKYFKDKIFAVKPPKTLKSAKKIPSNI